VANRRRGELAALRSSHVLPRLGAEQTAFASLNLRSVTWRPRLPER